MADEDPLTGLDEVPWADLQHAYGSAADVPGHLRDIRAGVQLPRYTPLALLWNKIVHQGTRYEATRYAVPFLARMALDPLIPNRAPIVLLLAGIAIGLDNNYLPDPYDPTEDRATLATVRAETDDWEVTLDRRIAEATNEQQRERLRELRGEHRADEYLRMAEAPVLAYEAVRAELPALAGLLRADSAELRAATAYLLAWFPECAKTLTPQLVEFIAGEKASGPAATGIVALGLLGDPEVVSFVRGHLESESTEVRWAAAVAASRLGQSDAAVIDALAQAVIDAPRGPQELMPFFDFEDRYRDLAALALARTPSASSTQVFETLVTGLARATGFCAGNRIAAILLEVLFPQEGEPPVPAPSFAQLDERRQRFLRTIAERDSPWNGTYRPDLHRDWQIPERRAQLRAYAGLEPVESCDVGDGRLS